MWACVHARALWRVADAARGGEVSVASAFLMSAIPGREGWGRTYVSAWVELTMSCEYGKQRGYDYHYTRNSVDERAAEGQYLRA